MTLAEAFPPVVRNPEGFGLRDADTAPPRVRDTYKDLVHQPQVDSPSNGEGKEGDYTPPPAPPRSRGGKDAEQGGLRDAGETSDRRDPVVGSSSGATEPCAAGETAQASAAAEVPDAARAVTGRPQGVLARRVLETVRAEPGVSAREVAARVYAADADGVPKAGGMLSYLRKRGWVEKRGSSTGRATWWPVAATDDAGPTHPVPSGAPGAVKAALPGLLREQPRTTREVAASIGRHPSGVGKVLRVLLDEGRVWRDLDGVWHARDRDAENGVGRERHLTPQPPLDGCGEEEGTIASERCANCGCERELACARHQDRDRVVWAGPALCADCARDMRQRTPVELGALEAPQAMPPCRAWDDTRALVRRHMVEALRHLENAAEVAAHAQSPVWAWQASYARNVLRDTMKHLDKGA